ncbi:methyltransferase domain-containing protein [Streptomyces liangshanensis]|uniref:Protein-L-isoaspartate O-methyltransferase n=1 Tax=Streptomyces liangshanensis TaxID=2717324 RepID=A0A6G9H2U5_9ACTN|nr:methyltransferase domain-containing protein [Streptomyces liangshanensis]QIQ04784.1 methyltransferase domain-containing protein [Streptomyces liangshanensis]
MGAHREQDAYRPDDAAADEARAALVREIALSGALDDPAWHRAFAQVPRHLFVPYYFVGRPGGYDRLWYGDPDPRRRERWLRGAYADSAIATRVRDGELISSSSQPSLMARMLHELGVGDGDRVLEIGAGSGYNAALLSHRLGEDHVTTIDLDPEITESARTHLATAGYRPAVVTGDGVRGCPERAPFDRIIATCALPSVPVGWLAQCAPGARILAPLATGLIVLNAGEARDAGEPGRAGRPDFAEGRFLPTPAFFVPLRGTPQGVPMAARPLGGLPKAVKDHDLFRFLLALTEGSLDPHEALSLWELEGRPGRERYGVTVSGGRQWAWLDDPAGPYVWPLEPADPATAGLISPGGP